MGCSILEEVVEGELYTIMVVHLCINCKYVVDLCVSLKLCIPNLTTSELLHAGGDQKAFTCTRQAARLAWLYKAKSA